MTGPLPAVLRLVCRLLAAAALLLPGAVPAAPELVVVTGLFRDRAVVEIDGKQRLLRAGETSPEGVTLIEADSRRATLEIDGEREVYLLGDEIRTGFAAPEGRIVSIPMNTQGMFVVAGTINDQPVTFHVDTGATAVALSSQLAARLGIDYRRGTPAPVRTASGSTTAWFLDLDSVQVGEIRLENVRAGVLEGGSPVMPLLGMSFLGRVDMSKRSMLLELRQQ